MIAAHIDRYHHRPHSSLAYLGPPNFAFVVMKALFRGKVGTLGGIARPNWANGGRARRGIWVTRTSSCIQQSRSRQREGFRLNDPDD